MAKRGKDAKAEIKIRLTEGLRSKIDKAAQEHGVSMNSEMIERLERSFEWERERTTVQEWLKESRAIIDQGREAAMRDWGFVELVGRRGLWWDKNSPPPNDWLALNPALETLIEKVIERTINKVKRS